MAARLTTEWSSIRLETFTALQFTAALPTTDPSTSSRLKHAQSWLETAVADSAASTTMDEQRDQEIAGKKQREQMLQLVARGFYNELMNYGVHKHEIVQVASHLLDNLLAKQKKPAEWVQHYNGIFTLASVRDEWADRKQLAIQHVTLRPLQLPDVSKV